MLHEHLDYNDVPAIELHRETVSRDRYILEVP
jgi:hypothetical protein